MAWIVLCVVGCTSTVWGQARITSRSGDVITLSVGARDGVKAGTTGSVIKVETVGGSSTQLAIATFQVEKVDTESSQARLTQVGGGFEGTVVPGLLVVFDKVLERPALATPTAALWMPEPGRDPVFYLRRGDEETAAGRLDRAAAYYRRVLELVPGDLLAGRKLDGLEARQREVAAVEAQRWQARELLANAEYYLKAGDELFAAGDKAGARAYWEKIAAVVPMYPGVQERLTRVALQAGEKQHFQPSDAEYAFVPIGAFSMGCVQQDQQCGGGEAPRHRVTLTKAFWMMTTEVTVGQYREFAKATSRPMVEAPYYSQTEEHPVANLTWYEAVAYCGWAGGRLPSEAEWEYAARGGREGLIYPWGDAISHDNANFYGTSGRDQWEATSPVGSFDPNGYGLYDMAGNVREWCTDWYGEAYHASSPAADAHGPDEGRDRVLRGGSWHVEARWLRVSFRDRYGPMYRHVSNGVRCVRDATQ